MTHNLIQVCTQIPLPQKGLLDYPPILSKDLKDSLLLSHHSLSLTLLYFFFKHLSVSEIKLFICHLLHWKVNFNEMSSGSCLVHCYTAEPRVVPGT